MKARGKYLNIKLITKGISMSLKDKLRYSAAAALLSFFSGCITAPTNGPELTVTHYDIPEINMEVTANVGEYLLEKVSRVEATALVVHTPIDADFKVAAGEYPQIGYDGEKKVFRAIGVKTALSKTQIVDDGLQGLVVYNDKPNELCVVTSLGITPSCFPGHHTIETRVSIRPDNFQKTLMYSGRVGNRLRISYREFLNDLARPAFQNEAEYDLDESNIISYQGARLEIIRADNNGIVYKVLKSFN